MTRETYRQRRQLVADKILARPENFNMNFFIDGVDFIGEDDMMCGTTLCIAGWAVLQIPGVKLKRHYGTGQIFFDIPGKDGDDDIADLAAAWLGMDRYAASSVFYGHWAEFDRPLSSITPEEAVDSLMAAPYIEDETP
jgi:hypothetical protein